VKNAVFAFCILLILTIARAADRRNEPTVVPTVDLERYQGTWHEIARLPNRFQEDCTGNVTATYELRPDGRIRVVNRCQTQNGPIEAEGVARLADKNGPKSKLEVRFAPAFLSFLPMVWGDYWILDLADDYSYALVGDPGRKYLWILARTESLPEATYQRLVEKAANQGYETSKLIRSGK
jgi:apolipoprotein D and lipocalin family protein